MINVVENRGFELPLAGEHLAAWAATIPMGGRVALDSRYKHGGQQSLLLASNGPAVSVTSESFEPPTTGRVAVEVWLRTAGTTPPPAMRIAVEGDLAGTTFNRHGVIDRVGKTAATPGDWVRYSFPINSLPSEGLANLRVRFELVGAGEVWIDDVQVFDLAFNEMELIELSKINSLASFHLEKGQYADCERVLEGYWPQYLLANVALTTANTPVATRPKPPQAPPEPPKKPSMLDTMRSYIPLFR